MTLERFQEVLRQTPFVPFTIRLADGRGIPVKSREFVASAPVGRTAVVFQPNGKMNIIDLLLVTDLDFDAPIEKSKRRSK